MRSSRMYIRRRLRSLRSLELINVVLVPGALLLLWRGSAESWVARLPALAAVAFLLVQGGLYWQAKGTAVAGGSRFLPAEIRRIYKALKGLNQVLLTLLAVYLGVLLLSGWSDRGDLAWGVGLTVFAVLEYVNYFHWQLSHDQTSDLRYLLRWRRLRESPLASDLQRGR